MQDVASCRTYGRPRAELLIPVASFPGGEERLCEARGLVEKQRAVFDRGFDLAAFVPLVPRGDQHVIGMSGDRLFPQDAVGLAAPALGHRARRRPADLGVVITGNY